MMKRKWIFTSLSCPCNSIQHVTTKYNTKSICRRVIYWTGSPDNKSVLQCRHSPVNVTVCHTIVWLLCLCLSNSYTTMPFPAMFFSVCDADLKQRWFNVWCLLASHLEIHRVSQQTLFSVNRHPANKNQCCFNVGPASLTFQSSSNLSENLLVTCITNLNRIHTKRFKLSCPQCQIIDVKCENSQWSVHIDFFQSSWTCSRNGHLYYEKDTWHLDKNCHQVSLLIYKC